MFTSIKALVKGDSTRFSFTLEDGGRVIEAILRSTDEKTLNVEVSTSVGCPVGCKFCGAGVAFERHLTPVEIAAQVLYLAKRKAPIGNKGTKTTIRFGMIGEPLMNLENVLQATKLLHTKLANPWVQIVTAAPDLPEAWDKLREFGYRFERLGLAISIPYLGAEDQKPDTLLGLENILQEAKLWFYRTQRKAHLYFGPSLGVSVDDLYKLIATKFVVNTVVVVPTPLWRLDGDGAIGGPAGDMLLRSEDLRLKLRDAGFASRRRKDENWKHGMRPGQHWAFRNSLRDNGQKKDEKPEKVEEVACAQEESM